MAVIKLNDETATIYNTELQRTENISRGCSIKIDDNYVDFLIPIDGYHNDNIYKTLRFSKIELRKLLEALYTS